MEAHYLLLVLNDLCTFNLCPVSTGFLLVTFCSLLVTFCLLLVRARYSLLFCLSYVMKV